MWINFLNKLENIFKKAIVFISVFVLSATGKSMAACNSSGQSCDPSTQLCNPLSCDSFLDIANNLIRILSFASGIVLIMIIMISAIMISVSGNSTEKIGKAKNMIKWGIIGFVIVVSADVILSVVVGLF